MVAPCQTHTHTHTHTCFPLWSPQVVLQRLNPKRMQGGTSSHGKPHNLHQTLKVGLSSAHLLAHALVGGGRLDKCACYETLTHIYPRCLPMKNSHSCSGWYTPCVRPQNQAWDGFCPDAQVCNLNHKSSDQLFKNWTLGMSDPLQKVMTVHASQQKELSLQPFTVGLVVPPSTVLLVCGSAFSWT